jgi:23S rRNA pseudouridine2605 synthase
VTGPLRLNRFLASAGVASRRRCDDLIRAGRVTVNGHLVTELGTRVEPERDEVALDGKPLILPAKRRTLLLNKPPEVLVAARDMRGRRTVMDIVASFPERVFPIGRLDYRSEGVLLFTNDGDLAYRLAHPRYKVEKEYEVEVAGEVAPEVLTELRSGVTLEDGPTQPARVALLRSSAARSVLMIALKEGRKRQVRRMLALFGLDVLRLIRVRFGPIALADLASGEWRLLEVNEELALLEAVGLDPSGAVGRTV